MFTLQSLRTRISQFSKLTWLLLLGLIWLIAAVVLWWYVVYLNPRNVFSGMLSNNFSTVGYTRDATSIQDGLTTHEIAQIISAGPTVLHSVTTLKQGKDFVKTEAINTSSDNYIRYADIQTQTKGPNGKPLDFTKAKNVWAKSPADAGSNQTVAQLLLGIFPMGNVPAEKRGDLLKTLHQQKAFTVDFNKVKKTHVHGRLAYTYNVMLHSQPYVVMLKQYGTAIGLKDQVSALNPAEYKSDPPTPLIVTVDAASRRIMTLQYPKATDRVEHYGAYGIVKPVPLPEKTITTDELQKILQMR
jgi:hypothetical protein